MNDQTTPVVAPPFVPDQRPVRRFVGAIAVVTLALAALWWSGAFAPRLSVACHDRKGIASDAQTVRSAQCSPARGSPSTSSARRLKTAASTPPGLVLPGGLPPSRRMPPGDGRDGGARGRPRQTRSVRPEHRCGHVARSGLGATTCGWSPASGAPARRGGAHLLARRPPLRSIRMPARERAVPRPSPF